MPTAKTCGNLTHGVSSICCVSHKNILPSLRVAIRGLLSTHASSLRLSSRLSDTEKNRRPIGEELTGARPNCVRIAVGYSDDYTSNPLVELAVAPFAGKPIDRSRRVLSLSLSLLFFNLSLSGRNPFGHETRSRDTLVVIETHRRVTPERNARDENNGFVALSKRRKSS